MAILDDFTPLVEPVSVDEAFVDLTGTEALLGDGPAVARTIKRASRRRCASPPPSAWPPTSSWRRSPRISRSRTGSWWCAAGTEADFLAPLPVARLWGVGR